MAKRKQTISLKSESNVTLQGLPQGQFFLLVIALFLLFQTTTFFAPHNEGDEVAYLALSHEMHWDFSNYTTRDVDPVNTFSNKLYRAAIFVHPPLFPFLLKFGWVIGSPVGFGLLLNAALKISLVLIIYLLCKRLELTETACQLSAVFVLLDPIIGFVSTRLLIDIFFTVGLAACLYFMVSAITCGSLKRLLLAAICFAIVLNTKLQGVLYLPLFGVAWIYSAYVVSQGFRAERWRMAWVLVVSVLIVALLGLAHHWRLYFTYGISGIHDLIYTVDRPANQFVQQMVSRSFWKMLLYVMIIQPWVVLLLVPSSVRLLFQAAQRKPEIRLLIGFALYLIVACAFNQSQQERYWAAVFPLLFILASLVLTSDSTLAQKHGVWKWGVMIGGLCLLFLNNFMTNVITPGAITATVTPVLFQIYPFLVAPGTPFFKF